MDSQVPGQHGLLGMGGVIVLSGVMCKNVGAMGGQEWMHVPSLWVTRKSIRTWMGWLGLSPPPGEPWFLGSSSSLLPIIGRKDASAWNCLPSIEKTHKTPPSSRDEGHLFLHGLESSPKSSLHPVVLPGVANIAGNPPGARQGRGESWRCGAGWGQL